MLPYCKPDEEVETRGEGLGEALQGYELMKSAVIVRFTRRHRRVLLEQFLCVLFVVDLLSL